MHLIFHLSVSCIMLGGDQIVYQRLATVCLPETVIKEDFTR